MRASSGSKGTSPLTVSTCIQALILLAMFCLSLWGLDKGLGLIDESFYLLSYKSPSSYPFISSFHYIISALPKLCANEIINYRLIQLGSRVVGAAVLVFGYWRWLTANFLVGSDHRRLLINFYFVALIGNFLIYSIMPQTFSYNGLNSLLACLSAGLVFYGLSRKSDQSSDLIFILSALILAGTCTGFIWFVKFSSAITLGAVTLAFILICSRSRWFLHGAAYLFGLVLAVVLYFALIQSYSEWLSIFNAALQFEMKAGNHGPTRLLTTTINSIATHQKQLGLGIFGAILAIWFLSMLNSANRRTKLLIGAFAMVISLLAFCLFASETHGFCKLIYVPPLIVLCGFVFAKDGTKPAFLSRAMGIPQVMIAAVYLLLIPIFTSLGTDSPMPWHMLSNFGPICVSVATLGTVMAKVSRNQIYAAATFLSVSIFCAAQFAQGYVRYPDELAGTLFDQTTETQLPYLKGIKLDPATAEFMDKSYQLMLNAGFKQGDPLLAIYDCPGLVYAAGARSLFVAWYTRVQQLRVSHEFANAPKVSFPRIFVLIDRPDGEIPEDMKDSLRHVGIAYPKNFRSLGITKCPYKLPSLLLVNKNQAPEE